MAYEKFLSNLRSRLSSGAFEKGNFTRNVLTITTGTALSQAITLAAVPLLARIYSPSQLGLLATFLTLSNTVSQLSCLGYQGAIVLPRRNESAFTLWVSCLILSLFVSAAGAVVFVVYDNEIAALLGNPELSQWLWLIPITMIIFAGTEATNYWCTRHKAYKEISSGVVHNRLWTAASQLGAGALLTPAPSGALVLGNVFGSVAGLLVLVRGGMRHVSPHYWKSVRLRRIRSLIIQYRHFPGYGLISSFVAAVVRSLPVFCLGYFFTPAIVGFFSMANRLVSGPVQLITNSVVKVFYERANRAQRDGNLGELTAGLYERLVILLLTPMALLSIAAPDLTMLLLSEKWAQTGIYLQWLSIWLFFVASISPLHKIFLIVERQHELAIINVLLFIATAAGLIAGGLLENATLAVAAFCISSSLVRLGQGARVMSISGTPKRRILTAPVHELLRSTPFIGCMFLTCYYSENNWIITGIFLLLLTIFALVRMKSVLQPRKN